MFTFFNSPPAHTAIKEANDHLQALFDQNGDLEKERDALRQIIESQKEREREHLEQQEILKKEYETKLLKEREQHDAHIKNMIKDYEEKLSRQQDVIDGVREKILNELEILKSLTTSVEEGAVEENAAEESAVEEKAAAESAIDKVELVVDKEEVTMDTVSSVDGEQKECDVDNDVTAQVECQTPITEESSVDAKTEVSDPQVKERSNVTPSVPNEEETNGDINKENCGIEINAESAENVTTTEVCEVGEAIEGIDTKEAVTSPSLNDDGSNIEINKESIEEEKSDIEANTGVAESSENATNEVSVSNEGATVEPTEEITDCPTVDVKDDIVVVDAQVNENAIESQHSISKQPPDDLPIPLGSSAIDVVTRLVKGLVTPTKEEKNIESSISPETNLT